MTEKEFITKTLIELNSKLNVISELTDEGVSIKITGLNSIKEAIEQLKNFKTTTT